MKEKQAELKAKLMARIEAEVNHMLELTDDLEALTLDKIEEAALRVGAVAQQQLGQALVELGGEQKLPEVWCPGCGQAMRYKGKKARYIRSRSGELRVARAYYYCQGCRQGFFPPR